MKSLAKMTTTPKMRIGFCMLIAAMKTSAFVVPKTSVNSRQSRNSSFTRKTFSLQATAEEEQQFDKMIEETSLSKAVNFFKSHPDLELTRDRWNSIFNAIEELTATAEENAINVRREMEMPLLSQSRMEMTDMYTALQSQDHLRLFGAITKENMPASGSHTVRPNMLEEISLLSMKALTPKPSNTLLYAGVGIAVLEGILSAALGLNLDFLFFMTIAASIADRILLNGALSETLVKVLSPGTQAKITRHEAGHFLCAYLLGCPVEGYVLSAWGALQDPRFGARGVSAGTSFFDPTLSSQINSMKVTRSSVDRYSIIVMGGIAAEGLEYSRADGGFGDEMALITFLSSLNGGSSNPAWNDVTIRNQARWGALQAVLIIREYKECYDALVDALERGGSLGDCIYAIENAGREHNKLPLKKPLGYILEKPGGLEEEWVKELPPAATDQSPAMVAASKPEAVKAEPLDPEKSLEALREYKEMMKAKLKDIDNKLEEL